MLYRIYIVFILLGGTHSVLMAQELKPDSSKVTVKYGPHGFEFKTLDNKFLLQIQSRLQFRFSTPQDQDPATYNDFEEGKHAVFKINRARLAVGGHAFQPWLKYYWSYELAQGNLLDFRVMIEKWQALSFMIGQWKIAYNRESYISSGKQQMVERSIINRPFTIDRQDGVGIYGHLKSGKKKALDFNYWLAALTGNGRGATTNDDKNLMYTGRLQWNLFGREVPFEAANVVYHEKPAAVIAVAGVTNRSPYTRFSQSGGGSLTPFNTGDSINYKVNQWQVETAFIWRGFSWQHEYHQKYVTNTKTGMTTTLRGAYLQAGYFFHYLFEFIPRQLELAGRVANYRPDKDIEDNREQEYGFVTNWFFKGDLNKLSAGVSYYHYQDNTLHELAGGWRLRLQWDISF